MLRGHQPIALEDFNGLYDRGDADSCPIDHFTECNNIQSLGVNSFQTRAGIDISQNIVGPLGNIIRIYNFITQDENTLLVLTDQGKIYHIINELQTVLGPILDIPGMMDFTFVPWAGRAYISPFATYNGIEKGMENQYLYVYMGDGVPARPAAGGPPINGAPPFAVTNGTGFTDAGLHLFGVVYEYDTGYLTAPSGYVAFTTSANNGVSFSNIPVSPSGNVVARRIVMTRVITGYNGDLTGYQYFFIPDGRIPNNTDTTLSNITVFDADLLEDASHLVDNYPLIPAGANLTVYHQRLVLSTTFDDISLSLVSEQGEPEAINQIDGLLISPLDGNPITNAQEMRDVLYVFKRNRTNSFIDNGDVPSSWPLGIIDQAIGCPVHGVSTVIDSGGTSIDYLIIASYKGLMLFNGRYFDPELSFKIRDFWLRLDREEFREIQIVNDAVNEKLFMTLPTGNLLECDYANGLDPKKVRWWPHTFNITCSTVALVNTDTLIIGSAVRLFPE